MEWSDSWDTVQCCLSCCWGQGGGVETEDGDWQGVLLQWHLLTSWPPSLTAASVVPVSSDKGSSRWLPSFTDTCLHLAQVLLLFLRTLSTGPLTPVEARSAPTPPSYCLCSVTGQGLLSNPTGTSLNLPWPLCICSRFFASLLFLREGSAVLHRLGWNS